ncbi:MAG: hypothetical protein ABTS16_15265 [Candidatus Accumulibacter phosphatis]|jgi:hypothetical protein|uniref:Uncharacterized protein n=1 Tax=Candidatus Accumulibacter contiguus TaxID=2954381 RepID=A0ABX1TEW4_9PROT|nr:hypothetical protein [Candidatus Accumulibacter contiguus]NMQ07536.1 hypothetical protein [Candidatus Accumulibacter contiguus]
MNAPYPIPQPDTAAILNALAALYPPDAVIELRSFAKGRKRTDSGYFDGEHRQALAEHAALLNRTGATVYVTLNPIDPQLLSRYANRIESGAAATTTDGQVTGRRWLLLDFDPTRPTQARPMRNWKAPRRRRGRAGRHCRLSAGLILLRPNPVTASICSMRWICRTRAIAAASTSACCRSCRRSRFFRQIEGRLIEARTDPAKRRVFLWCGDGSGQGSWCPRRW